jgi:hypothetical protein
VQNIPERLEALLSKQPGQKADVTGALGDIRKLLDLEGERQRLTSLNLFCDWVVAGKLDPEPARDYLTLIDDRLGQHDPDDPDNSPSVDDALGAVSFSLLRDELEEFLERVGLPLTWTEEDPPWDRFVELLAEALISSPLRMNRKNCGFTRLREVVLTVWEPEASVVGAHPGPVFGLKWECTLDDKRTFSLSRVELPAEDEDDPDETA